MNIVEPRTIEELVVRYRLEPTIRDVFVEGSTDKSLIQWFLDAPKGDVLVYEISTVNVPNQFVSELQQEINRRGRVVALAHKLRDSLGRDSTQATCIVDRDFTTILEENYDCALLFLTDYACMEMYAFNVPTMEKFLNLVVRGFPKTAATVLAELAEVLQQLFLIRLANKLTEFGLSRISWEKCCSVRGLVLQFEVTEYIARYLNTNAKVGETERFMLVIDEWRLKLSQDPRQQIQGHDFTEFLTWYIYKHRGIKEINNLAAIQRSLLACIEKDWLTEEPLFQTLLKRLRGS